MAADAVAALLSGYRVSRLRNGWKALGHRSEWGFTTPRIECHLLCNVLFYRNSYLELRDRSDLEQYWVLVNFQYILHSTASTYSIGRWRIWGETLLARYWYATGRGWKNEEVEDGDWGWHTFNSFANYPNICISMHKWVMIYKEDKSPNQYVQWSI